MRPMREKINLNSLALMGIPLKFSKTTLDDFELREKGHEVVKSFVDRYIAQLPENVRNGRGILFMGSNGTGKTMLSSIILIEAYRRRYNCRRITFSEYLNLFTSVWDGSGVAQKEELTDHLYEFKGSEFLCLEEVGKEIDSKIAVPILEDLLRYREDHSLPTIICTNRTAKALEETYGNSIVSLLRGNNEIVKIVGKDGRYNA